jgi:hypothetical protein
VRCSLAAGVGVGVRCRRGEVANLNVVDVDSIRAARNLSDFKSNSIELLTVNVAVCSVVELVVTVVPTCVQELPAVG